MSSSPIKKTRNLDLGWRIALAALAALACATAIAGLLLTIYPTPIEALAAWASMRWWLVGAQLVGLACLWRYWPSVVAWLCRHSSDSARAALVRGRVRIFVMLGVCEALIIARAVSAHLMI